METHILGCQESRHSMSKCPQQCIPIVQHFSGFVPCRVRDFQETRCSPQRKHLEVVKSDKPFAFAGLVTDLCLWRTDVVSVGTASSSLGLTCLQDAAKICSATAQDDADRQQEHASPLFVSRSSFGSSNLSKLTIRSLLRPALASG